MTYMINSPIEISDPACNIHCTYTTPLHILCVCIQVWGEDEGDYEEQSPKISEEEEGGQGELGKSLKSTTITSEEKNKVGQKDKPGKNHADSNSNTVTATTTDNSNGDGNSNNNNIVINNNNNDSSDNSDEESYDDDDDDYDSLSPAAGCFSSQVLQTLLQRRQKNTANGLLSEITSHIEAGSSNNITNNNNNNNGAVVSSTVSSNSPVIQQLLEYIDKQIELMEKTWQEKE